MRKLIQESDVFIHNVRKPAIQKLSFGYEDTKRLNPELIYVHCVGFGSSGPYNSLQAYDDVIQAASGMTTLASRVDGDPTPRYVPSLIADKVAGLHAVYATMAAIIHKLRTGNGQFVEVPMFEAFTSFLLKEHLAGKTFQPPVGTSLYDRQIDPNRQPFPTADGYISIVPYSDKSWFDLFESLGSPETLEDERFNSPKNRMINISLLYAEIAKRTPSKTTDEWIHILRALPMPCMAVRDIDDILNDPHLQKTGFFQKENTPLKGISLRWLSQVIFPMGKRLPKGASQHAADQSEVKDSPSDKKKNSIRNIKANLAEIELRISRFGSRFLRIELGSDMVTAIFTLN